MTYIKHIALGGGIYLETRPTGGISLLEYACVDGDVQLKNGLSLSSKAVEALRDFLQLSQKPEPAKPEEPGLVGPLHDPRQFSDLAKKVGLVEDYLSDDPRYVRPKK